jgi:CheY-like chemotaxis protein
MESINEDFLKKLKVLVVEDDVVSRALLSEILKRFEMQAVFARNGKEALDIIMTDGDTIDIILMDLKMPIMNGYESTKRIRESGFTKPIIAQTAYATGNDLIMIQSGNFDGYISKPIDKNALLQVIKENI